MTLVSNTTPHVKCQHVLICGYGLGPQLLNPLSITAVFVPLSYHRHNIKKDKNVLGLPNFSINNWSILGCTNISDF